MEDEGISTGLKYVVSVLKREQIMLSKEYNRIISSKTSGHNEHELKALALILERLSNITQSVEILEII